MPALTKASITAFEERFNPEFEEKALAGRVEFMRRFPVARLASLRLGEYAIGKGPDTFCSWVEPRTKEWAFIQGATAHKFGIYFGVERHDPHPKYRFTKHAAGGETKPGSAFRVVRSNLVKLVNAGKARDFDAIDNSVVSPMFRAKILSLYYPDVYLNVCAEDTIQLFGEKLGIEDTVTYSEMQHELLRFKNAHAQTRDWSNPKFMLYLHFLYMPEKGIGLLDPRRTCSGTVDWKLINERRDAIGKMSEAFAKAYEERRLASAGLARKIPAIEDRTDQPAFGYDFLSFSSATRRRRIEVKTATRTGSRYCFYLSRNEEKVSRNRDAADYYFYIVYYDENRVPRDVMPMLAKDAYGVCEQQVDTYRMVFDRNAWGQ